MTNPFPKCISKDCPVAHKCLRKMDGGISAEADYDRVIMDDSGKCYWYIEAVLNVSKVEDGENETNEEEE